MVPSLCLVFMLYMSILPASAQQVSKEVALEKAIAFLQKFQSSNPNMRKAPHKAPQLALANNRDEFYIFNDEANGGYVIVSGDERTPDVLGYSDGGRYDSKNVPCNMQAVLDGYAEQVAYLRAHPEYKIPVSKRTDETKVAPLLGETAWDQWWPYNEMCPTIDGQHCPTGCVATATSQVMFYHKWPERGKGSNSYEWNGQTLFADFSQSVYRWDLMTPTYNSNSSKESCDAVALLMHDVGYACNMSYSLGGSGASDEGRALIKYFDYDKSMGYIQRDECDEETWYNFILDDLHNGRPLIYGGGSSIGGHALVIDGYDGNGYYHFNFGWGGASNGNYTMLSVPFNSSPSIYFGIKKNEGGNPRFIFSSPKDFIYNEEQGYLYVEPYNFCPGVEVAVYVGALAVENIATHEVIYVDEREWASVFYLNETLSDGDYILYPVGRGKDETQWQKYYFHDDRQTFVDLNVTNGVKTYANNHLYNGIQEGAVEIDDIYYFLDDTNHEATVTFKNDKYGSYSGDVTIPSKISYKNQDYIVTKLGYGSFFKCELGTLYIPKSIKNIEMSFYLANVDRILFEADAQVKSIVGFTFQYCSFHSGGIDIPEGIESLSQYTFSGADIKWISLPSTLQNYYGQVFSWCNYLRTIILNNTNPIVLQSSPFQLSDLSHCTLYVPKGSVGNYSQAEVWKDFGHIVEMEDTTTIGGIKYILDANDNTATILSAFEVEQNSCTIPSAITYHGKKYKVTNLSPFSFINSPVEKLTIPSIVEYIGECALDLRVLKKLHLYHNEPPKVADMTENGKDSFQQMFSNVYFEKEPALIELHVPVGSKSKYQSDSFWGQFTNIVEDETLGIESIMNIGADKNMSDIYDINGRKVELKLKDLKKGVYIVRGKKVVK